MSRTILDDLSSLLVWIPLERMPEFLRSLPDALLIELGNALMGRLRPEDLTEPPTSETTCESGGPREVIPWFLRASARAVTGGEPQS